MLHRIRLCFFTATGSKRGVSSRGLFLTLPVLRGEGCSFIQTLAEAPVPLEPVDLAPQLGKFISKNGKRNGVAQSQPSRCGVGRTGSRGGRWESRGVKERFSQI